MIDFACKKFDIDEVIRCGFGLTKAELKVLKYFISRRKDYMKTTELSNALVLDLTTVQRAVKKLYSSDLLQRNQKNISGGGYVFEYCLKDKKEIKTKILLLIESWTKRVEKEFDKL